MRLHFAVTLCLILLEASQGSFFAVELNEKCDNSREMNKLCGEYANNIVKPMMAYFRQVNQQIENHDEEIESKKKQIRQLKMKVADKNDKIHKLEIKVASYESKDQLYKEKDEHVKSLKQHVQTLTNSIETQEKQNIEILQLIEKTKLDIDKANKCETELNDKEGVIVNDKKVLQLETEVKRLTDKSNELESLEQQLSLIKNTNEQQNHNLTELNKGIRVEAAKAIKCETELKSKQEVIAANDKKVYQLETEVKRLTDKSNELESLEQQLSLIKNTNEQQNHNLTELNKGIRVEAAKAIKCETELKSKQEVIAANDKKVYQLETEVKRLTDKSNELESLEQQLSLIKNTNEQQNHNLTELNKGIRVEAAKAIKCETELKSKQEVIAANDNKVLQLETEVKRLTDKSNGLDSLKQQFSLLKNINEQQINNITELNKGIRLEADKAIKCETELKSVINESDEIQKKLNRIEGELKKANQEKIDMISRDIKKENAKSCIGHNSTGVYNVTMCNGFTFEVLCNSDIAGPGWTIIQQRIKGGVDFYRNWETYRNGFGDFWDGDFFLGLEKIHRLTTEQPHELYIHMEQFNGSTFYARYNEFAIAGEGDQYRVIKLSGFSGSKGLIDRFSLILNMKFSTYDRDNDTTVRRNCAKYYKNGWWNKRCYNANLNGIYHESEHKYEHNSVHWHFESPSLKQVKMMIRPKTVSK